MGETSWRQCSWGDIVELRYGKALSGTRLEQGPVTVFGTNGPTGVFTDEALTRDPTIIVGRKGAYRGVCYVDTPSWTIDTAFWTVSRTDLDLRWAASALGLCDINGLDSGSAIPSTSREDVYALPVALPPLPEQRAIAGVLGALDDKIESNRRVAEALETTAQRHFTALSRGPVEGDTPLTDAAEIVPGRSYKSTELAEQSEIALVSLKCITAGGGFTPAGLKAYDGPFKPAQVVRPSDIVVAVTDLTQAANVVGHPAVVNADNDFEHLVASLDLVIVRPHEDRWTPFVLGVLQSKAWIRHARSYANGSTVLHLNKSAFSDFAMRRPSEDEVDQIYATTSPLRIGAATLLRESRILTAIRDALLPKLVSGQIRVPLSDDVDEQVGHATEALTGDA